MVEMRVQPEIRVTAEKLRQFFRYTIGQDYGHTCSDSDYLHMLYGAEFVQNPLYCGISKHQRITAGYEYVSHFGGLSDVGKPFLKGISVGDEVPVSDFTLSGTVTAVHSAHIAYMKKNPVGVAVGYALRRAVNIL